MFGRNYCDIGHRMGSNIDGYEGRALSRRGGDRIIFVGLKKKEHIIILLLEEELLTNKKVTYIIACMVYLISIDWW